MHTGVEMQMSTSSYLTALQGVRAVWNYLRKKDEEPGESEHEVRMRALRDEHEARMLVAQQDHDRVMIRATTLREAAAIRAEASAHVAEVEGRSRASKLAPVMAAFETVQVNKRARLMSTESGDFNDVDDDAPA